MSVIASPFTFDASRVHHRLYLGSRPQPDTNLSHYDVVVFCAYEHQPPTPLGKIGIHVPLHEDSFPDEDAKAAHDAARLVAEHVTAGRHVLVTCLYGRNRSALVAALALHELFGWEGLACMEWVRRMRKQTLHNHRMNDFLLSQDRKTVG